MSPFWTFGDLVFLLLAYIPVSTIALTLSGSRPGARLAAQLAAYAVWFAIMAALFRLKYGRGFWKSLAWTRPRTLVWAVPAGAVLMVALVTLMRALSLKGAESPIRALLEDPTTLPLALAAVALAGPLAEELFFRGFAQPLMVKASGRAAGILLTAAAFGLLHLPQARGQWHQVALVIAAGSAFGLARHISGSTLAAAGMHAAYNSALVGAYFWEKLHG